MKRATKSHLGQRIVLNVSGEIFETTEFTLQRFPTTLLGDTGRRGKYYCANRKEYFFDRNRHAFQAILFFFQSNGTLLRPLELQLIDFERECIFFGLPEKTIKKMRTKEGVFSEEIDKYTFDQDKTPLIKIWNFLENPETSKGAHYFALFSLAAIVCSVVVACLETITSLNPVRIYKSKMDDPWFVIELFLNCWFLLELILRFSFCPKKPIFVRATLNWMDFFAVVPYFFVMAIQSDVSSLAFLRILRFIRVIRLFRLSKHSKRLKVVGEIMKSSVGDLQQLFLCLMILVIFGGSLLYFTELGMDNSQMTSIPESLWWAVQTVVVLGFGDVVPVTVIGKIFATGFMLFGALTIALPVLSIVMKFTELYVTNTQDL